MSKYDFELKLTDNTSLGCIATRIDAGSDILEFGAATGRFTQYLKGEGCKVSIVEIDAESASIASEFADKTFVGDIEQYEWEECFTGQTFDFIIFADVLEHLYDPGKVLQRVQKFLKKGGRIVVSIPNIAHNSIIINLINNRFPYSEVGLLDNTHIRFFTIKELKLFFSKSGLKAVDYSPTLARVEETELPLSYDDVAPEVASFLKSRAGGDVYQHVFSLEIKKSDSDTEGDVFKKDLERVPTKTPQGFSQLYWADDTKVGFSEESSLRFPLDGSKKQSLRIETKGNVVVLRLDPLNGACSATGIRVQLEYDDEKYLLEPQQNDAVLRLQDDYYFPNNDPGILYEIPLKYQKENPVFLIDFTILNNGDSLFESSIPAIENFLSELQKKNKAELSEVSGALSSKEAELSVVSGALSSKEAELSVVSGALSSKEVELSEVRVALSSKEVELSEVRVALSSKEVELSEVNGLLGVKEAELSEVRSSLGVKEAESEARCSSIEKLTDELRKMTELAESRRLSSRIKRLLGLKRQ